jgi:hypothetical protein
VTDKLNERWLRGLSEREKGELFASLQTPAFRRLVEIINELDSASASFQDVDYQNPSWSHYQAHRNGERSAYRKLLRLITPFNQKD